jgi:predicted phosphodiesterase
MRIAIVADIHGNLAALHAVMAELERLQPDYVVLDGDLINGAPFSAEVIDVVRAQDWAVVRGNHEFYLLDFGTPRAVDGSDDIARWGQLHWLVERVNAAQSAYLALLPDERTLYLPGTQPIGVAHGVPGRNRVGFYNDQPEAAIAAELGGVYAPTFISAHTHVQVDRHVSRLMPVASTVATQSLHNADSGNTSNGNTPNGNGYLLGGTRRWHVINPGSVGLPLNGDVRAQFAIIESVPEEEEAGGWHATHYRVAYDRRSTLEAYNSTGMAEAGGVITQLFYWEVVTAESEIVLYYRWARAHGFNADADMLATFDIYCRESGRAEYVRARDPLFRQRA